ncbi:2-C-methyl-D-erythritol 4-phosphate cytidylyltransferase [Dissulfurirhabdus thermomarina]|uniref:2-C-methyl-D-erythritol 4-phosphate cytidylyltransferase n=1 Tax=Dissulfurirhabdus thermomarina TaxID=1765737 RepID=A0A6N9TPH6_DISTH|nr:2-C-methyl-D-erythritol 4-phosphate cytidylyltransferase [Dissulfurirhabdus thermomarina]NDY43182.1 2-C-methyl-D-erythritol 4-phosphate cytidylyltransferase [Dissulfurirhabdus thermomarina]NMX22850.1 2-C-methyl-D-erythritol 4-phosphate cytidylyltransferase [Dissulfurirhabdus thermomarina]
MKVNAIVAAAGVSRRMGAEMPKQFLEVGGRPLLAWTLEALASCPLVEAMVVVAPPGEEASAQAIVGGSSVALPVWVVAGGTRRQDSVRAGLSAVGPEWEWVAVHDAARPFVAAADIEATCLLAREVGAAVLGTAVHDTVKEVDEDGFVVRTLDRSRLLLAQTPQVCRRADLERALARAEAQGLEATDEAALLEAVGQPVGVVLGSRRNFKITTPDDLAVAEAMFACRAG